MGGCMSLIKAHFVSRYSDGLLLNGDLKAIEMVVFAQLSRDRHLLELLNNNIDMHLYMYEMVYGIPMKNVTKEQRNSIKAVDFGIIYGNGPKTASERTGLPEDECKSIIETFYEVFPNTKVWQHYNLKKVEEQGYLRLQTGSLLNFQKYPAKYDWQFKKGIVESYNPPDIKNYPVQHTAGLIMFLILGEVFKIAQTKRTKYLMINTVHDSLMLDCQNQDTLDEAQQDIQEVINNVPRYMLELWGIKMLAPITMEFSQGKTWIDLKEISKKTCKV